MKLINSALISLLVATGYAYNNMTIDQIVDQNNAEDTLMGIDPKGYFDSLLTLPPTLVQDLLVIAKLKAPEKLQAPTTVRTPPPAEVKRHFSHATFSYCIFSKLIDYKCKFGCPDYKITKTFEHARYGTFALVGYEENTKEIVVSHRGSFNIQNWLRDLSYGKAKMPNTPEGVLVHEGFLGVYQSISAQINDYILSMLQDPKFKGYKVVFTGQSLGGAVATIHAVDMAPKVKAKGFETELYAYHSPRVGNQAFRNHAISLNFPIARYTNRGDLVSHMAPRQWDYVHIPGEFHTDFSDLLGKEFHSCSQEYDEDPNCGWKEVNNIWLPDHLFGFGSAINFIC